MVASTSSLATAVSWWLLFFVAKSRQTDGKNIFSTKSRVHSRTSSLTRLPNRVGLVTLAAPDNVCLRKQPLSLLDLRGGAVLEDDDDDDEEEEEFESDDEEEDDEEDDDFDLDDADDVEESDFQEVNMLDRGWEAWLKTPPLTKLFLQASMATTLLGYGFCKNEFPKVLSLEWKPILKKLQVWRLVTSFFNLGPMGLSYVLTVQFVWMYMSTLERLSHNKPYDFWIMMLFGMLAMVVGYPLLEMSPRFLGHNLSTYFVYVWSRYHEGVAVNLFGLFDTRAELLPWFFLAQTFLLEGELPTLDLLGIVFGHIYHHCKTAGVLRAPPALIKWYQTSESPVAQRIREQYKTISSDFEMQA